MKGKAFAQIAPIAAIILSAVVYGFAAAGLGLSFWTHTLTALVFMVVGAAYAAGAFQSMRASERERQRRQPNRQAGAPAGMDEWLAEQDRRHGL